MNEHAKNITGTMLSAGGILTGWTLKGATDIAQLGSYTFGAIAGMLTIANIIYGWIKKK